MPPPLRHRVAHSFPSPDYLHFPTTAVPASGATVLAAMQLHCIRHCIRVECAHRVRSHAYLLRDFDSSCCVSRMKSRVGVWCVFALVLAKQSGNGVGVKSGYVYSLSASLSGTQVFTSSVILETQALTSRLRLVLPALRGEVSQTGYTYRAFWTLKDLRSILDTQGEVSCNTKMPDISFSTRRP